MNIPDLQLEEEQDAPKLQEEEQSATKRRHLEEAFNPVPRSMKPAFASYNLSNYQPKGNVFYVATSGNYTIADPYTFYCHMMDKLLAWDYKFLREGPGYCALVESPRPGMMLQAEHFDSTSKKIYIMLCRVDPARASRKRPYDDMKAENAAE